MKILFVHEPRVPAKTYGGTERILYWLIKELVILGHEVYLIGNPDSDIAPIGGKLIPYWGGDFEPLIPEGIDILHLFLTPNGVEKRYPTLVTIHGNGRPGEKFIPNTVFLSKKHAENHGTTEFVYNGVDFDEYPFIPKKTRAWEDFMFLAKASWSVKNLKHCVKSCRGAKKHLHVAGGRSWMPSRYIHNYGMVDQTKKLEILRKVDGLMFPVRWHEPFGVAPIEAMSQGVPVLASPYGSLPELVSEEVGIICNNYDELFKAVSEKQEFDPEVVRKYAETNFSSRVMAENYVRYYKRVIAGEQIHDSVPQTSCKYSSENLLPF